MGYKHKHCVIPTVALVKPRETLPESERRPRGGGLIFFHCLSAALFLVPSAGSDQEAEVREKLTGSFFFFKSQQQRNKLPERSQPSFITNGLFLASAGSSVQMESEAGDVNERLLT